MLPSLSNLRRAFFPSYALASLPKTTTSILSMMFRSFCLVFLWDVPCMHADVSNCRAQHITRNSVFLLPQRVCGRVPRFWYADEGPLKFCLFLSQSTYEIVPEFAPILFFAKPYM